MSSPRAEAHLSLLVSHYASQLSPEDRGSFGRERLEETARRHLEFASLRRPGHPLVDIAGQGQKSLIFITNDDMPFLVDSLGAFLTRSPFPLKQVLHPILLVERDPEGQLLDVRDPHPRDGAEVPVDTSTLPVITPEAGSVLESWICLVTARVPDEEIPQLTRDLHRVLRDVRDAVEDWKPMLAQVHDIAEVLGSLPPEAGVADQVGPARKLLRWLTDDNYTFLGYREYELVELEGEDVLSTVPGTGLGVLKDEEDKKVIHLTPEGRRKAREKNLLVVTKTNSRSTVHRPAYLDYIGVKTFDAQGNVRGERRFIGLFASSAYTGGVKSIPVISDKVREVMRRSGFPSRSHSGKDLLTILETFPRDELFQIETDQLEKVAMEVLRLQERRRTRLFLRPDVYGRFMSALVYLPRDRYTTAVRLRIEHVLREEFNAEAIDFEARMTESALARLYLVIRLPKRSAADAAELVVDEKEIEGKLVRAVRSWGEAMAGHLGSEDEGQELLLQRWREAFPPEYRVAFEIEDAVRDLAVFEGLEGQRGPAGGLRHDVRIDVAGAPEDLSARVKVYVEEALSLSHLVPFFHHLGLVVLDERPYRVLRGDGKEFHLYDFGVRFPAAVDAAEAADRVRDSLRAALFGQGESDSYNKLVLSAGLTWRETVLMRTYARYLRQIRQIHSYTFIGNTLHSHPRITRALVELFRTRFDPDLDQGPRRAEAMAGAERAVRGELESITTLDADKVLRTLFELIQATDRTNFYQLDPAFSPGTGEAGDDASQFTRHKKAVSLKVASRRVAAAVDPKPLHEIWVYSPDVEGVHLRFGDIARGGLRWSDRREDFRTEILGLVKAQAVKNAVIVPAGAKGGFYVKNAVDPARREQWMEQGRECYRTFIRCLLDVTDNIRMEDGKEVVVPPRRTVRHDGDDTYLVVAADKGTATFSDIANAISAEYGFWLGDAFASGGSVGYDHKQMGITARGAWESVKRHFLEMGVDTQSQDFTVVGIGDMSGDVFGNGMLLSPHIRLVAAFDHRHVFLDPDPDAAASFAERRRLFGLPRSSWDDYDRSLISAGGGVFPRSMKSITVSEEAARALGLDGGQREFAPADLISRILRAPVDLLFNGGIGTYVKASGESHEDAADRANDAVRVDGSQLRAKVVGEGGNLGLTQRGRIEASLSGVRINTDAIDNSAGVDCSDHEVNIKILLDRSVAAGRLDLRERNELLAEMTDEVAALVLEDNIDQNLLLSGDRRRAERRTPTFVRFMRELERGGELNRELEHLPSDEELALRRQRGQGLTSPELAVMSAYAKLTLTSALADSALARDPWAERLLEEYFPRQLRERFPDMMGTHPLRDHIVATVVANRFINNTGITGWFRLREETSAEAAVGATAFMATFELFGLHGVLEQLEDLSRGISTDTAGEIRRDIHRLIDRSIRRMVRAGMERNGVRDLLERYAPALEELSGSLLELAGPSDRARITAAATRWREQGVPVDLARSWAQLLDSYVLLDIADVAHATGRPHVEVARCYFEVFERYGVDRLLERISSLPRDDRWQSLARISLRDDLYAAIAQMTRGIVEVEGAPADPAARVDAWEERHRSHVGQLKEMFVEVTDGNVEGIAPLAVALRQLRGLLGG